jgi:hypothetical protein
MPMELRSARLSVRLPPFLTFTLFKLRQDLNNLFVPYVLRHRRSCHLSKQAEPDLKHKVKPCTAHFLNDWMQARKCLRPYYSRLEKNDNADGPKVEHRRLTIRYT